MLVLYARVHSNIIIIIIIIIIIYLSTGASFHCTCINNTTANAEELGRRIDGWVDGWMGVYGCMRKQHAEVSHLHGMDIYIRLLVTSQDRMLQSQDVAIRYGVSLILVG